MQSRKTLVLIIAASASFLTPFISSAVYVALPSIGKDLNANAIILGWIATAYLLAAGMFSVPFGKLADIKGRNKILVVGLTIFVIGSILSALTTDAIMLIAFRAVQGIGGAMIFATVMAIISSAFPLSERGKALGINAGVVYAGLTLGPLVGGFLTQVFGWRSVFLICVPIGMFAILLSFFGLKGEETIKCEEKFDFIGALLFSTFLLFLIYGFANFNAPYLLLGIALLVVFVLYEKRVESPILDVTLFTKNITFSFSSFSALLCYAATAAVAFMFSLYLQYVRGLSPANAGVILLSRPSIMIVFAPLAGWLSDKIEPRIVSSVGLCIITISLFLMSTLTFKTPLSLIVLYLVLLGLGSAIFTSPNTNAIMSSVERRFFGVASAIVATMRLTGQLLSVTIGIAVFYLFMGNAKIVPEHYGLLLKSIKLSFVVFTAISFVAIFLSLKRGRIHSETHIQSS